MWSEDTVLKKSFLKGVLNLSSGYGISQIIALLLSPLLSRLYSPEEFGVFFFFITTASILSILATGGYEKAIVVVKTEPEQKQLFRFAVLLVFAVTIISLIICLVLQLSGRRLFEDRLEKTILWSIPLYSLFFGLFRILLNLNIRNGRFRTVASSFIIRSSTQGLFQAGCGATGIGSPGLILGSCLGQIIPVITQSYKKGLFKGLLAGKAMSGALKKAREFFEYPLYRMPSDLMNEVSIQTPVYILKTFFSNATIGLYTFPQKILYQPSKFLSQPVADVFFSKASDLNSRDESVGELTLRTYKLLFISGIIPYLSIVLWGPEIFSFVFGKEWEAGGRIAAFLSPWMFLVFVGSPISSILLVRNKLRLSFTMNLILLIARVSSLLSGALIFKDAELTIILFSAVSSLYWIFSIFYSFTFSGARISKALLFSLGIIVLSVIILVPLKIITG
jgi:O-antigen/teichoic acid export membrane protein